MEIFLNFLFFSNTFYYDKIREIINNLKNLINLLNIEIFDLNKKKLY